MLTVEKITIDSSDAAIGMYVSMLDRPWLETPFVFQGFTIRDRMDIELLQSYCSDIQIDVQKSGLTRLQVKSLLASATPTKKRAKRVPSRTMKWRGKLLRRLRNLLLRFGLTRQQKAQSEPGEEGYKVTSTVRGEAANAYAAYKALSLQYLEVVKFTRESGIIPTQVVNKAVRPFIKSILRNPDAMAWTIFSRRDGGLSRAVATSAWCVMFGRHLGFDRDALSDLAVGGLLLDIGNIHLPADVLNIDGEMNREQFLTMSKHVEHGLKVLRLSGSVSDNVRDMVQFHHERADGSGYPMGLHGNKIPVYGRIAAIADAYDAMTTKKSYSQSLGAFDAARALNDMRGKQFSAEVVEQFLCTVGMFPTASVVELNNGMTGLVLEQNRDNTLRPRVMLLLDRDRKPLKKPKFLEMRDLPLDATHPAALWIVKGHEHGAFGIDPKDYFTSGD